MRNQEVIHNGVRFEVEEIEFDSSMVTDGVLKRFQCIYKDQVISSVEKSSAVAIMSAIYFINTYPEKF